MVKWANQFELLFIRLLYNIKRTLSENLFSFGTAMDIDEYLIILHFVLQEMVLFQS